MQKDKYIRITLHISLMIMHITLMGGYKYNIFSEGSSRGQLWLRACCSDLSTSVSLFKASEHIEAS